MPEHGTRSCYNGGCREPECVQVERDYNRSRRQSKKTQAVAESQAGNVTPLRAAPAATADSADGPPAPRVEREMGEVETAVMAEVSGLSTTKTRPALVATARSLARVLDTPMAIAQHPSAAHRLAEMLRELRKGSDVRGGRLASVQRMTGSRSATG